MGMLSSAIGAGAGAVADQAKGLIDAETRVNAEKELMAAREQMEMRLRESQEQTRRSGRQADFDTDIRNAPAKAASDAEALRKIESTKTDLALGRKAAESDAARRELPADAAAASDPRVLRATQAAADAKESTSTKDLRKAQAKLYSEGGAGAAAARVRSAGSAKGDDEKTAQATVDRYLKTAKAAFDDGDVESARVLREKAQLILAGIEERQAGKGKGAAAKTYPPIPSAAEAKLLKNPALRSDFDAKYGPGAAALILGD